MMTINSLCLASIVEFMDEILEFKREHKTVYPTMSLNILRFPSFQSCAMLPTSIRQLYKNKLQTWLDDQIARDEKVDFAGNGNMWPILTPIEREQVQRLIDYLDVIKTPHKNVKDMAQQHLDFKNFYTQYDVRRGKDFCATFPEEFVNWYNSIETPVPTRDEILAGTYSDETGGIPDHPPEDPSAEEFFNPDLQ